MAETENRRCSDCQLNAERNVRRLLKLGIPIWRIISSDSIGIIPNFGFRRSFSRKKFLRTGIGARIWDWSRFIYEWDRKWKIYISRSCFKIRASRTMPETACNPLTCPRVLQFSCCINNAAPQIATDIHREFGLRRTRPSIRNEHFASEVVYTPLLSSV